MKKIMVMFLLAIITTIMLWPQTSLTGGENNFDMQASTKIDSSEELLEDTPKESEDICDECLSKASQSCSTFHEDTTNECVAKEHCDLEKDDEDTKNCVCTICEFECEATCNFEE